jgi:nitrogen fixation protein NifU and related proteins
MSLQSLYQELILQHYRRPRNRGVLERPDAEIAMHNPLCGDEITLQLQLEGDRLSAIRFSGHGCSISQASASMMAQQLEGKTLAEARHLAGEFTRMMHGDPAAAANRELGDLRALAGVAKFPVRIKCALLAWNALSEADRSVNANEPGSPP